MGAPKGNQFWKARSKHGRDKIFSDANVLRDACEEYFQWVEDNPLVETKVFHSNGIVTKADVNIMRPMTVGGLCLFLGITTETWSQYRKQKDFSDVIEWADGIIYQQKFAGATAGLMNANIIARDLGLSDKSQVDHSNSDGSLRKTSIDASKLTTEQLKALKGATIDPDADE